MPKLTVGILTTEQGRYARFWNSMMGVDLPKGTNIITKTSLNIAEARNEIIRESRHSDFVWFMDDDHVFEHDLATNLLSHNVPVVQPIVLRRFSPFGTIMMGSECEDKPGYYNRIVLDNSRQRGLIELNGVGAAGMMIRRDVLQKVGDPWFENPPGRIAEDVNFCEKARKAGFKIYCDLSNSIGHLNVGYVRPVIKDGVWQTELTFGDGKFYLPAVKGHEE